MCKLNASSEVDYPRVLVVNAEPFGWGSATAITMSSLFKGWPCERLACLYASNAIPDQEVCSSYWQLTWRDLRSVRCIMGEREKSQPVESRSDKGGAPQDYKIDKSISGIVRQLRKYVPGQSLRELDTYWLPPNILTAIRDFSPQVIYSMLGSNTIMQLVIDLAQSFAIPVVPHFMDDWVPTLYQTAVFKPILRAMMHKRLMTILDRAPARLVIGDAMKEAYAQKYGGEFSPFMNTIEPELLERPVTFPLARDRIRMVYVGGLHLNRWRALVDIAMALRALWYEGFETETLIYTQPRFHKEAERLEIAPVMRLAGSVTSDEVPDILREADIVLHVESFENASRRYARYSMSTKIPQAMAAARPIFAYGPEELASIRYVHSSQAGITVGYQNKHDLQMALKKLITSVSLREQLGKMGRQIAAHRHNAALQRESFRAIFSSVAYHD